MNDFEQHGVQAESRQDAADPWRNDVAGDNRSGVPPFHGGSALGCEKRRRGKMDSGAKSAAGTGQDRAADRRACRRSTVRTRSTQRQIQQLHDRIEALRQELTSHLDAWEKTELARHPQRPYTLDYIERIFTDWSEIHGDRGSATIPPSCAAWRAFTAKKSLIVGHQKARDTKQNVYRNFGMPNPEGYRKALRVMKIAEKFQRPIFTFVDTTAHIPDWAPKSAARREAIARNLRKWRACKCRSSRPSIRARRQRRRAGHRRGRPRADDGKLRLFRDLARRLRVHHVARRQQERAGRRGHAHYRRRFE